MLTITQTNLPPNLPPNFKAEQNIFTPQNNQSQVIPMDYGEDVLDLESIARAKQTQKEQAKENWQKAGVIAQCGLAFAFLGLLAMEVVKHKFSKKALQVQEEQFKRQFPDMADKLKGKNPVAELFKDVTKDTAIPDLSADSINPKLKKFINETIESLKVSKEICEYTGSDMPPRMLLLHGPTGTGKTFTAKIFAKAQGAEYAEVQFSDVSSKYVGETSVFISNKFKNFADLAKANPDKKYVVAFNEIDSLINNVEKLGENNLHLGQNRTSFLNGLDSIKDIPNLTIVGTTNINPNSAKLDAATLRRFGNVFEIPLPTKEELRASLKWQLHNCKAATEKYDFMKENASKVDAFLDKMVKRKCAHGDMETIAQNALNKFKLDIKDKPDALSQKFDIKYLEEALKEKEVIASGIGAGSSATYMPQKHQSLWQIIKSKFKRNK